MHPTRIRCAVIASAIAASALSPAAFAQCEQMQTLYPETPMEGPEYGASLSISGDWMAVGAPEAGADDSGVVHLYQRDGADWVFFEEITSKEIEEFDDFGRSVSLDGNRLIVGAPGVDLVDDNEGAAYVFEFSGGAWIELETLTAAEPGSGDRFGWDVALDGDLVIVGAFGDDTGENSAGAAYALRFDGASWNEEGVLVAEDPAAFAQLGRSVAVDGDRALVGAWQDDDAGFFSGGAYTFTFDGDAWSQEQKLTAGDAEAFAYFGLDVDLQGSFAIIGAYGDAEGDGFDTGAAYIFVLEGTWSEQQKLMASDPAQDAKFGWSVALDGGSAWVGAVHDSEAEVEAGALYHFRTSGSGWNELTKFSTDQGGDAVDLGAALAAASGEVAVSAPNWSEIADDGGAVIVQSECLCPADFNGDGTLNVLDFVAYQTAWVAQNVGADCDSNGVFNVLDFVCYSQIYGDGCP